jgi:hypothetical protein
MNKSIIRIMVALLCLVFVGSLVAGCEKGAAKEPAVQTKPAAEKAPLAASAEKPKEAPKPAAGKAQTLGPYGFTANWMDEPGFITHWLIVGPFPNPGERPDNKGFNTDYLGGEAAYVPTNGKEVKDPNGNMLKWQQYISTYTEISFFAVEHLKLAYDAEDVLCYAACWVESDADKDVEIRMGSDDGYKLWLNGKEIAAVHEYRSAEMDQETHKVKLNKGVNLIMLKVDQDWGEYQFMCRIVGSDGKAVSGLKVWN